MSNTGTVGVGVIGAGVISSQYLENLTRFPDLEVSFVADLDRDRAAAQARKYGIPGSGTVADLLAIDAIEIVVNLTIPAAHVDVGLQILDAGKHVWAEKPFALDREGGRLLLDRAVERGLRVASAPDTFLGAGLQTAQRLVDAGEIGAATTALALFRAVGPESWHPNPEFLFAKGGGPLYDMGPYYLTALVQLFGPVARVTAAASTSRATRVIGSGPRAGTEFPVEVPTHHAALVDFESGASAQVVFSFESRWECPAVLEVAGTTGALALPDPNAFEGMISVWTDDPAHPREIESTGVSDGRGIGVLELARAIRTGVPERAHGQLAFHVLDVIVSIDESARSGVPALVPSTAQRPSALPVGWDPKARTV
ncbi:Gfo/Idh/MocA family oxidoreductase [Agromyces sp. SYSU K20354]|uniref:Gfo/Idh/MocA family protein n=1 Tax=Agromyces cavernae TaxID=2898659 RepID=UPI001E49FC29|nr:Gfo/Idh/MocA family oxidoreductase [Agromyces cavernae]MCD2443374.1 Gfo/Idh/MocA family oxidoreductase [Agromyces cavernae]